MNTVVKVIMVVENLCGICNERVKKFGHEAYGCELCPRWIHAACAFPNASGEDLKTLFKFNHGFDVKCNDCKRNAKVYTEQLMNNVKEIQEKLSCLASNNTESKNLETIQSDIVESVLESMSVPLDNRIKENFQPSCKRNTKIPRVKHALLLKPNQEDGSSYIKETWTEVVKKSLPLKLPDIPVDSIKLTKNGMGYLSFPDQTSRDNAANNLKSTFAIESKDNIPKLLLPKIKISGLAFDSYDSGDAPEELDRLKEAILKKNDAVKSLVLNDEKQFEILFIRNDLQRQETFAIAKIDSSIRQVIRNNGDKLFIDLTSCRISDQIHVIQCYTCQSFGHKKNSIHCPMKDRNINVCLYCSENHLSKDCIQKRNKAYEKYKCSNCAQSKVLAIREKANGHTTTSSKCPILQQEAKALINRTAGMPSKNDLLSYVITT